MSRNCSADYLGLELSQSGIDAGSECRPGRSLRTIRTKHGNGKAGGKVLVPEEGSIPTNKQGLGMPQCYILTTQPHQACLMAPTRSRSMLFPYAFPGHVRHQRFATSSWKTYANEFNWRPSTPPSSSSAEPLLPLFLPFRPLKVSMSKLALLPNVIAVNKYLLKAAVLCLPGLQP